MFPNFSHHHSIVTFGVDAATITFSSIHQTQLFPFVFVHPLSLSAHTIGFFDSLNPYYRSYLAVSQHFTPHLPLLPLAMYDPHLRALRCLWYETTEKPSHILISTYSYCCTVVTRTTMMVMKLHSTLLSALSVYGTVICHGTARTLRVFPYPS